MARARWLGSITVLSALTAGVMAQEPSAAERKAVATLAAKGVTLQVDANYRIVAVTLPATRGEQRLTDDDFGLLKDLSSLKSVSVFGGAVSDAAVDHLAKLDKIERISMMATDVSEQAVERLRQALPNRPITVSRRFGPSEGWGRDSGLDRGSSRSRGGSVASMVREPAIRDELKLTEEQTARINALLDWQAQAKRQEDELRAIFDAGQWKRIEQIQIQRSGGPGNILRADLAADLKLTDEQKAKIQKEFDDQQAKRSKLSADRRAGTLSREQYNQDYTKLGQEAADRVLAILTEEQRKAWSEKIGPPAPATPERTFTPLSTDEVARRLFESVDQDKSGSVTAAEWAASRYSRMFEDAKVTIELPMNGEAFTKHYRRYLEVRRPTPSRGSAPAT